MDVGEIKDGFEALKIGFQLFKDAIGWAKSAKDKLPNDGQKTSVEEDLEQAEKIGQLAEAQIAKALGYHLCKCTFPPQIMLRIGYDEYQREQFRCPKCNTIVPPPYKEIKVERDFDPRKL
jgi:hypothetical protein